MANRGLYCLQSLGKTGDKEILISSLLGSDEAIIQAASNLWVIRVARANETMCVCMFVVSSLVCISCLFAEHTLCFRYLMASKSWFLFTTLLHHICYYDEVTGQHWCGRENMESWCKATAGGVKYSIQLGHNLWLNSSQWGVKEVNISAFQFKEVDIKWTSIARLLLMWQVTTEAS